MRLVDSLVVDARQRAELHPRMSRHPVGHSDFSPAHGTFFEARGVKHAHIRGKALRHDRQHGSAEGRERLDDPTGGPNVAGELELRQAV